MPAGKRVRRQMARVEFLACRETVNSMLEQGFSKKLIHERLTEEGRFSMAYITLCQIIRKIARNPVPAKSPAVSVPARSAPRPGIIRSGPEPMQDPRTVDPKSVI
jgi:hypothetical protein